MDVGFQDGGDLPAALSGLLLVDGGIEGRIEDEGGGAVADEVGEAAFAGASDLDDLPLLWLWRRAGGFRLSGGARFGQDGGRVPGQAPGAHASLQGVGGEAAGGQKSGGALADQAGLADGDDGPVLG